MKYIGFSILCLFTVIFSCCQTLSKKEIRNAATKLNDSAVVLMQYSNADSSLKAADYLNRATTIDTNFYLAYWNKLILEIQLKRLRDAIEVTNNLIRIRPASPDLYVTCGILNEKIENKSTANNYFNYALKIYKIILDTMDKKNNDYNLLLTNMAITIIILGDQIKGNKILQQIYVKQNNEAVKQSISELMNKNKDQLIDYLFDGYKNY
jgi:tetratricopeptide (TPR) repeat protein